MELKFVIPNMEKTFGNLEFAGEDKVVQRRINGRLTGKEYIFQELVNPIHNRKDNQVTVSLTVEYIDQQTKATQVSQFDLVLEKNGSNWKIVK